MYIKQLVYCNCCGKELHIEIPKMFGRDFKCCSMNCINEMKFRETLSILGKEYYTRDDLKINNNEFIK